MKEFPSAVPEIPVRRIDEAIVYYVTNLGFTLDWGDEAGGIAGLSRERCRIFLTNPAFRKPHGNAGPIVIWLNLESRDEVNELHAQWSASAARIVSPPEAKPWKLYELTASDLDGNLLRVFYDFSAEA